MGVAMAVIMSMAMIMAAAAALRPFAAKFIAGMLMAATALTAMGMRVAIVVIMTMFMAVIMPATALTAMGMRVAIVVIMAMFMAVLAVVLMAAVFAYV